MPVFYEPGSRSINWPVIIAHYTKKGCSDNKALHLAHKYCRRKGWI